MKYMLSFDTNSEYVRLSILLNNDKILSNTDLIQKSDYLGFLLMINFSLLILFLIVKFLNVL
jgi:hypothetical protein